MAAPCRFGALVLMAVCASACRANDHGHLAARGTGGEVTAALSRRSALDVFADACPAKDAPRAAPGVRLRRWPYLQRVSGTSADVVFTATGIDGGRVVLWPARGGAPAEVAAAIDASAPLPDGAVQLVAHLSGLSPGTVYCYEVWAEAARLAGPAPFRTAPEAGAFFQLAVLGDSGDGGSDQAAVLRQLDTVPFDLMIHVGDLAYERGRLEEIERNFFGPYRPLLGSVPVFPASGNHEYLTDDAAPFRQAFVLPDNGGPAGRERWYSFDWGDVHFVALDTEKVGAEQSDWLDEDLAATSRPWKIVYGHRPPRSSGSHGTFAPVLERIAPLLAKHRVPVAFFGHDHHYERFHPQDGVTYVIAGGGGRGVRTRLERTAGSAFAEAVLSFVHVEVTGGQMIVRAIDATGRVFDAVSVPRP